MDLSLRLTLEPLTSDPRLDVHVSGDMDAAALPPCDQDGSL